MLTLLLLATSTHAYRLIDLCQNDGSDCTAPIAVTIVKGIEK
jgi:hypothetical protein